MCRQMGGRISGAFVEKLSHRLCHVTAKRQLKCQPRDAQLIIQKATPNSTVELSLTVTNRIDDLFLIKNNTRLIVH